ncbi:hypothetical protein FHR84_000541 [Actinopolyspora biskrensis]|uniref:Uncharacterized protein n=1 Tax=Actinopolyspora biskrensis TaxID=1470178 RepID=A0A852Z4F6_9ACTN|nr:hypothetical protein [Actinopolyspora biskrensis]NYH77227.1 hypothetical protein [Actinopolyspora biskrensis]
MTESVKNRTEPGEEGLAGEGITDIAIFTDLKAVSGYQKINRNINNQGTALYLGFSKSGKGSALVNLVFHLAWMETPDCYSVLDQDLNQGAKNCSVPLYLATTARATEGDKPITNLDVIESSKSPAQGWKKVPLSLNIGVPQGENLNLAYLIKQ